jgi:5-methylcytosine-specific restriction endonuclease McrA
LTMEPSNAIFFPEHNLGGVFSVRADAGASPGRLNAKVLILNQNYEPLSVINVRKAVVLLYLGKVELVEANQGRELHAVTTAMPCPSIVRLSFYVRIPYKKIILSRKNILRRDGHCCQYCGRGDIALTIDHVHPLSRGGEDTWENLVCACVRCNNRKGDRMPEEAAMPLRRSPIRPNHVTFIRHFVSTLDDRWKPYLFQH